METIALYIDRLMALFGTEASLWTSVSKALLTLVLAFVLWLIAKRVLAGLEKRAVYFRFIQVRKELFAVLRKAVGLALIWLVGVIWIRLFHLDAIETIHRHGRQIVRRKLAQ